MPSEACFFSLRAHNVADDLDAHRNRFVQAPDRKTRQLLLEFPENVKLNANLLSNNVSHDHSFPMLILPVKYTHAKMKDEAGQSLYTYRHFIAYLLPREDIAPSRKGGLDPDSNKSRAARLAESLAGAF